MMPSTPALVMTPDSTALAGAGATGCAVGSQPEDGQVEKEGNRHRQHDWRTKAAYAEHQEGVEDELLRAVTLVAAEQEEVADGQEGGCDNRLAQGMHERQTGCQNEPDARHHAGADADDVLLGVRLHDDVRRQQAEHQSHEAVHIECLLRQPPHTNCGNRTEGECELAPCNLVLEPILSHVYLV